MASPVPNPIKYAKRRFESAVYKTLTKFGYPPFGRRSRRNFQETEPAYERQISPMWLKNAAEHNALINNSIEEKVQQTFRRGFTQWTKMWEAKCLECKHEFNTLDPFKLDEEMEDSEIDMDSMRICPECGEYTEFLTPDPAERDRAEKHFRRANMRDRANELIPDEMNSVAQTFLEVCEEVAWDIQTFDDGWMIFERTYTLQPDGSVYEWDLEEVFRAPPYLMRYSIGDDGKIGGEYWVCLQCRGANPDTYTPQEKPGPCEHCENRTYEVFAYMLDSMRGKPAKYYVRGEFAHGSEYRPRFLYGHSPILSVWQEARSLEQMDSWYQQAYEHRRAPRGAVIIKSSNAESVRSWNTEQMEKLQSDPNHIPTFIDDTDGSGDPLKWQPLLENPAQMQHMQMREWFLDRISAKFGVTAVFQTGGADSTGMSQSLEIVVANRSAQRLKSVFDDIFLPAMLGQLQVKGWERGIMPIEEEDEKAEAERIGSELRNAQTALDVGAEVLWTKDDKADIKPGELEKQEPEGGGGPFGFGDEPDPAGTTTPSGGRPREAEQMGGMPQQPDNPTTEEPYRRGEGGGDGGGGGGTVTTDSGGYSSPGYSGEPGEVIDYLTHVQQQIADSKDADSTGELVEQAKELWKEFAEAESVPTVDELVEMAQNPNRNFHSVRRTSDDWPANYELNEAVHKMYDLMEATQ